LHNKIPSVRLQAVSISHVQPQFEQYNTANQPLVEEDVKKKRGEAKHPFHSNTSNISQAHNKIA
jgi:hypothetical protein